ncbi:MAG: FeoA family protein [Candidatus Omnitrophica bacterium]|nr:FeoA family protein [Candidatus Omnitrophota bacterium]MDD5574229.1 FeoA family protein [Candidatus Omnitrophota bacterium]
MQKISLIQLKKGTKARIVELAGGKQVAHRLSMLGLRLGAHVVRLSTFALRGPVAVRVGHTTLALGHGMAEKVIVEIVSEPASKSSSAFV